MKAVDFAKFIEGSRKKILFGQNLQLTKGQKEDYLKTCKEMIVRIYNGRESISYEEWMDFRNELQQMVWHYEFHQFDLDHQGNMSAFDFAQSILVYYVPFQKLKKYQDHLNTFEEYKEGCVSFKEYVAFQYFLTKKNDIIQKVVENKQLDLADLRELADEFEQDHEYCLENEVHISDEMLDVFIHALDVENTGVLEPENLAGILSQRKTIGGQK